MQIWCLAFSLLVLSPLSSVSGVSDARRSEINVKFILGEENLRPWKHGVMENSEAPGPGSPSTLVLAEKRTNRPDILRSFKHYHGGWDIANRHYWASVGFTGVVGFTLAVIWFVLFGLALVVHHCCGWKINIKGKELPSFQRICLIMLIVFTCAASIGCILLWVGQEKFHGGALHTLKYVVNQSDYTVQTLRNVTEYLSLAKSINVAQVFLPSNVKDDIDRLNVDLNTAANTLTEKTSENSVKVKKVFTAVKRALITVAAVMLLLVLLGLFLSILGYQQAVHVFILSGWLLVTITFILCGVFVILNNSISDTCVAMGEWMENPHAESALSNILPCVDKRTTNQTLIQSKEVITDIVNIVNQVIYTNANSDPTPTDPRFYNQSGPPMPPLCYPFDSRLRDSPCWSHEVSMADASAVWENYRCTVSESGLCNSTGRVTPDMYKQLVAAVNVSYALQHYTPLILNLQDCNFVQETFGEITSNYCPPLEHYLKIVDAGLGLIAVGVMLCLLLWMLYANRPQREEVSAKLFRPPVKGGGDDCEYDSSYHNSSCSNDDTSTSTIESTKSPTFLV